MGRGAGIHFEPLRMRHSWGPPAYHSGHISKGDHQSLRPSQPLGFSASFRTLLLAWAVPARCTFYFSGRSSDLNPKEAFPVYSYCPQPYSHFRPPYLVPREYWQAGSPMQHHLSHLLVSWDMSNLTEGGCMFSGCVSPGLALVHIVTVQ